MPESDLTEAFDRPVLDSKLRWTNEPPRWSVDTAARCLRVEPAANTDFWQKTHYGFEADNGHLLSLPVVGDFVLTTHVHFSPVNQYDQAGLMVRLSPECWIKSSVEYEPREANRLGVVVTNAGYSDWSTQAFPDDRRDAWLRIRRESTDYLVESSEDGARWTQLRMAHLLDDRDGAAVEAGVYACSPQGSGFVAEFTLFSVVQGPVTAAM